MATNTHNSKIAMAVQNRSSATTDLCPRKRTLDEYATPPKRKYHKRPEEPKEQTVKELIAAGSDLVDIMSSVCQLTNPIHPIFRDDNLCFCGYAHTYHCVAPRFAANPPRGIAKIAQKPLPYHKDKLILRTILQLASRMITHPQTLPFWAGLIDAVHVVVDGEVKRADFVMHSTRLLDPARTERTLQALEEFKGHIRVHFKNFVVDDGVSPDVDAYAPIEEVRKDDPAYIKEAKQHYAYHDGKATIETSPRPFLHVFINLLKTQSLRPYEEVMDMTISEMKVDLFDIAKNILHEFSRALEQHYCYCGYQPRMNDELVVETGFSLEDFLFGGIFSRNDDKLCLDRWPSGEMYKW